MKRQQRLPLEKKQAWRPAGTAREPAGALRQGRCMRAPLANAWPLICLCHMRTNKCGCTFRTGLGWGGEEGGLPMRTRSLSCKQASKQAAQAHIQVRPQPHSRLRSTMLCCSVVALPALTALRASATV